MNILFLCGGNVARSQMAEAIFNHAVKGTHTARSAGTKVTAEREGQKLKDKDMNIVAVMEEIGIDVSNYERKMLTPEMAEVANKIIVMMPSEKIPDYVSASSNVIYWEVPDPFEQSLEFARGVRDNLRILVERLVKNLP